MKIPYKKLSIPDRIIFNLPDADITLYEDFFDHKESEQLYQNLKNHICWQQDQIKIWGRQFDLPRLTAWYGDSGKTYTYAGISMLPHAWNDDLQFIRRRVEQTCGVVFSSCLLNFYRSGKDSMGWHRDNEPELGQNPVIASISLGEARIFQLKHCYKKDLKKSICS